MTKKYFKNGLKLGNLLVIYIVKQAGTKLRDAMNSNVTWRKVNFCHLRY